MAFSHLPEAPAIITNAFLYYQTIWNISTTFLPRIPKILIFHRRIFEELKVTLASLSASDFQQARIAFFVFARSISLIFVVLEW